MENTSVSKQTIGFGLAAALCSVLNALLVIAKEESKAVQDWMQKLSGHHWITHVILMLAIFGIGGWIFAGWSGRVSVKQLTRIVTAGVIAGVGLILGFYLMVG